MASAFEKLSEIYKLGKKKAMKMPRADPDRLSVWFDLIMTPGHFALAIWQTRRGVVVAPVWVFDSTENNTRPRPLDAKAVPRWKVTLFEVTGKRDSPMPTFILGVTTKQGPDSTCWARTFLNARAAALYLCDLWSLQIVPTEGLHVFPNLVVTDADVTLHRTSWAPFFFLLQLEDHWPVATPMRTLTHPSPFIGVPDRIPYEVYCGQSSPPWEHTPKTWPHKAMPDYGFSDHAVEIFTARLDLVVARFSVKEGFGPAEAVRDGRRCWVRARAGARYQERKDEIRATVPGSDKSWSDSSWQQAVETVVFAECLGSGHMGSRVRSARSWYGNHSTLAGSTSAWSDSDHRLTRQSKCTPCRVKKLGGMQSRLRQGAASSAPAPPTESSLGTAGAASALVGLRDADATSPAQRLPVDRRMRVTRSTTEGVPLAAEAQNAPPERAAALRSRAGTIQTRRGAAQGSRAAAASGSGLAASERRAAGPQSGANTPPSRGDPPESRAAAAGEESPRVFPSRPALPAARQSAKLKTAERAKSPTPPVSREPHIASPYVAKVMAEAKAKELAESGAAAARELPPPAISGKRARRQTNFFSPSQGAIQPPKAASQSSPPARPRARRSSSPLHSSDFEQRAPAQRRKLGMSPPPRPLGSNLPVDVPRRSRNWIPRRTGALSDVNWVTDPVTDPVRLSLIADNDFLDSRVKSFFGSGDQIWRVSKLGDECRRRFRDDRKFAHRPASLPFTEIQGQRVQLCLDYHGTPFFARVDGVPHIFCQRDR